MELKSLVISAVADTTEGKTYTFRNRPKPDSVLFQVKETSLPLSLLRTAEVAVAISSNDVIQSRLTSNLPLVVTPTDGSLAYASGYVNIKTFINVPPTAVESDIESLLEDHIQLLRTDLVQAIRNNAEVPY